MFRRQADFDYNRRVVSVNRDERRFGRQMSPPATAFFHFASVTRQCPFLPATRGPTPSMPIIANGGWATLFFNWEVSRY